MEGVFKPNVRKLFALKLDNSQKIAFNYRRYVTDEKQVTYITTVVKLH